MQKATRVNFLSKYGLCLYLCSIRMKVLVILRCGFFVNFISYIDKTVIMKTRRKIELQSFEVG